MPRYANWTDYYWFDYFVADTYSIIMKPLIWRVVISYSERGEMWKEAWIVTTLYEDKAIRKVLNAVEQTSSTGYYQLISCEPIDLSKPYFIGELSYEDE